MPWLEHFGESGFLTGEYVSESDKIGFAATERQRRDRVGKVDSDEYLVFAVLTGECQDIRVICGYEVGVLDAFVGAECGIVMFKCIPLVSLKKC